MTQLALGTVQFGLPYGITNANGQVSQETAANILQYATGQGIQLLDTATAYGQSEQVLTSLRAEQDFQIVSKTLPLSGHTLLEMEQALSRTLMQLAQTQPLYGLLVHHPSDLLTPLGHDIYSRMQQLKDEGKIRKIGVSVYSAHDIQEVTSRYPVDLIQIPHNILDQRLRHDGWLQRLQERGVEIHTRSAFLQGLLLQPLASIPGYLSGLSQPLARIAARASELDCSLLTLALAYLRQQTAIDKVIVGVVDVTQLADICQAWALADILPQGCADDLGINNEDLLNPALWPALKNK